MFETLLPSPLGRVAERSEVGRGSLTYCFLALFRKMAPENLFRQPFGLLSFPKGEGKVLRASKLQTPIFHSVAAHRKVPTLLGVFVRQLH